MSSETLNEAVKSLEKSSELAMLRMEQIVSGDSVDLSTPVAIRAVVVVRRYVT